MEEDFMCGITAYCGKGEALPFLMQGLSKLEYRGYDSAGITTLENSQLVTIKCKGRLENLENKLKSHQLHGHVGIGPVSYTHLGISISKWCQIFTIDIIFSHDKSFN